MKLKNVLTEAGAGHATTADFWSDYNGFSTRNLVKYNGKTMTLKSFLLLSKKEPEAGRIIDLMKRHPDYRGSVGDFILNVLKSDDGVTDLSIRSGGIFWDQNEIDKNLNKNKEKKKANKKEDEIIINKEIGWYKK